MAAIFALVITILLLALRPVANETLVDFTIAFVSTLLFEVLVFLLARAIREYTSKYRGNRE
ncbi:hypothetical protein [Xenorhabdus sp. Sc-CR9]|uniref:hypothetical protein n=1 Tax=Xenorhabdus sp. Sc-CR9 TaxID=2584468 RepID=UPI001F45939A|nr:hypothetical protein [Xenorhabdus sp. Sc-CR9]